MVWDISQMPASQVKCIIPISQRAAKAVRAKTLRVLVVFCGLRFLERTAPGHLRTSNRAFVINPAGEKLAWRSSHGHTRDVPCPTQKAAMVVVIQGIKPETEFLRIEPTELARRYLSS